MSGDEVELDARASDALGAHADPRAELTALAHGLRRALARRKRRGLREHGASSAADGAGPASTARSAERDAATASDSMALAAAASISRYGSPSARPSEAVAQARPERGRPTRSFESPSELRATAARIDTLEDLRAAVAGCTACSLCETRQQTVFSDGAGRARVVFVGEAPGADEDQSGVPFVGRAGALLTDIVTKGMGLAREDVYITNVLKCRPPGNRDPSTEEKALCTAWLDRQLELLEERAGEPPLVIALGRHAAMHLLDMDASMGRMRGRVHERVDARGRRRKLIATYHPSYLLRQPESKRACWQDIRLALRELGLAEPPRR